MGKWVEASITDKRLSAYQVAENNKIVESAVEKDWWVTAILDVVFRLSPSPYMFFKGGTSLSKGWGLIDRFSEDIDIALHRDFYYDVLCKECAKAANNNQIKKLRIANRDYILTDFVGEFRAKLNEYGLSDCEVIPVVNKPDGSAIDHDRDPVVIEVQYPSVFKSYEYMRPVVKIEISCLSMKEPYEVKHISSLVGDAFPEIDNETHVDIPTISPTRTFLEKAFLLNEEYQRKSPRAQRMSRHLYDLERLMDTSFASDALADINLYNEIIEHRRRFYHVGGVDYNLNYPHSISFCPTGDVLEKMRIDYEAMKSSMIYGDKLDFDTLISRLEILQLRFREIGNVIS